MNIHIFLFPVISLVCFLLGLIAFIRNRKSITNLTLFSLCTTLAIWILTAGFGLNIFPIFIGNLTLWGRATIAISAIIGIFVLYFAFVFPNTSKRLNWLEKACVFSGLIIFFLASSNLFIMRAFAVKNTIDFVQGPLWPIYVLWWVAVTTIFLTVLYRKYRSSRGLSKLQLKYIFLGLFILAAINIATSLIGPVVFHSFTFAALGVYSVIIFVGFTTYAIVRHRLLDIRLVIVRSIAYAITFTLIIAFYVAITYFITMRLKSFLNRNLVDILILLLAITFFNPLSILIQNLTDRIFYRGRYNFSQLLASISDIIAQNQRNTSTITNKILKVLIDNIRIEKGAFILLKESEIESIESVGYPQYSEFWRSPIKCCLDKGMLIYDELEDEKIKELLRAKDIVALLPLITEKRKIAALALGAKKSGDTYTTTDLKLFELSSTQIALALENAKLYEQQKEVAYFNQALADIDTLVHSTLNFENILDNTLTRAAEAIGCEVAGIHITKENLWMRTFGEGLPQQWVAVQLTDEKKLISSLVEETKKLTIINDTLADERIDNQLVQRFGIRSLMVVPLIIKDEVIGLLFFDYHSAPIEFTSNQIDFAAKLSYSVALAYENSRLFKEVQAKNKKRL